MRNGIHMYGQYQTEEETGNVTIGLIQCHSGVVSKY